MKRKNIFESKNNNINIQKIRNISDSIQDFLFQTFIETDSEHYTIPEHDEAIKSGRIKRSALYYRYIEFCEKEEINPVKKGKFFEALESNGIEAKKIDGYFTFKIDKIIKSF
ncbi:MAG: primase-like DNA-binding domain-containing protein [Coprobacillaceae bacterium]